jgi:hypothetical protein
MFISIFRLFFSYSFYIGHKQDYFTMEVAAFAGLAGIGYALSRLTGKKEEGFQTQGPSFQNFLKADSGTVARKSVPGTEWDTTVQGATFQSRGGSAAELDMMYQTPGGNSYRSEPSPGPYGMPVSFATQVPTTGAFMSPLEDATAQMNYKSDGTGSATYLDDDYVSPLSGQRIPKDDFKHNNMQPFYKGREPHQNMRANAYESQIDTLNGTGSTVLRKQEVESFFDTQKPFGNPNGLESVTDFYQSRVEAPRNRAGERPFEPTRVGPGVGEGYGSTGSGGFQQFEVNEVIKRAAQSNLDIYRTVDNAKTSYYNPVIPGAHMVGKASDNPGEVHKNRPDTFYINENNERVFSGGADSVFKEMNRAIQVLPDTNRQDTTVEYTGTAASTDTYTSYTTGSYRAPNTKQYESDGFRNADMQGYYTPYVDGEEADYGRSSYENRPNERTATGSRTMAINLSPAESGQVITPYVDDARPTRRIEIEQASRQIGPAAGYAGGAPSVTVWDPNNVARTTVKETTSKWDYFGPSTAANLPNKLKVYDPADIPRTTQKIQLSNNSYYGNSGDAGQGQYQQDAARAARLNESKQKLAQMRKPIAGNGGTQVFQANVNPNFKKIYTDSYNNRTFVANRATETGPGVSDVGTVKFRAPLRLDMSRERFDASMVSALNSNPYNHNISGTQAAVGGVPGSATVPVF